jgi:exonuclease III
MLVNRPASSTTIVQWNANGLRHTNTRLTEFKHFLATHNPSAVLLSETHWDINTKPRFSTYTIVRNDRVERPGGGVAILAHKSLKINSLIVPSTNNLEAVGITIVSGGEHIDVISAYSPHGNCTKQEVSAQFECSSKNKIIGGDFNGHHALWESNSRTNASGRAIVDTLLDLPDNILITPKDLTTRVGSRPATRSTIDLIFASAALALDATVSTGCSMGSDHFPIQFHLIENPEFAQHVFYNSLMEASHRVFRLIQSESKHREPSRPWLSQKCKDQMKEAEAAKAEWIDNISSIDLFVKQKKATAIKTRIIKKAQTESWQNFASDLDPRGVIPKVWKFMKAMQGIGGEPSVDTANLKTDDGTTVTDAAEKAELFLNFFDISSHLDSSYTTTDPSVTARRSTHPQQTTSTRRSQPQRWTTPLRT